MTRLLFILISFLSFSLVAQDINIEKSELEKILCKSWKIDYMISNGEKMSLGEEISNSGMEFKTDYTFTEIPITKKGKKGTWKYNEEKHLIELFMENKLIGNIKSITTERILFLPFLDEDAKKIIKSAEIHLKVSN